MGFILQLAPLFAIVAISFACGYGVRELMSRRRREVARRKFREEHPEFGAH